MLGTASDNALDDRKVDIGPRKESPRKSFGIPRL